MTFVVAPEVPPSRNELVIAPQVQRLRDASAGSVAMAQERAPVGHLADGAPWTAARPLSPAHRADGLPVWPSPVQRSAGPSPTPVVQRDVEPSVLFPVVQQVADSSVPPPAGDSACASAPPAVQRAAEDATPAPPAGPAPDVSTGGTVADREPEEHTEEQLDVLAGRLYSRISARLRRELRIDRERAGLLSDLRR